MRKMAKKTLNFVPANNSDLKVVVLEDPVRRLAARALYLSYCPIEMYVK